MGWMWSSSQPPSKGPDSNSNSSSEPPKSSPPTKQVESEYSDPEIAKFMAQLQSEFGDSGSKTKPVEPAKPAESSKPAPPSSSSSAPDPIAPPKSSDWTRPLWSAFSKPSTTSTSTTPPTPSPSQPNPQTWTPTQLDPLSESLLPTTMSCRTTFDAAFHCNSLGGQWLSVYREGNVRSCSEHWDDFWFCMRTRALASPQKENMIRDRYRRKEYAKYYAPGQPSSTDVWESRTEKLEPGTAFNEPLEMPDVSDEEWRRQEIERRRRVREMLEKEESSAA
ncbi:hypothetical protein F5B19DRAFT_489550 [Rostrohypoxylon terebratum]|nr:hypothetical protein F5B19DRAFT_489550 [Rostrohypoxylon terebratum]